MGGKISKFFAEDKIHACMLLLTFGCGILLRLAFLSQPMRWDESHSFLSFATQPFVVAISNYSIPNNHILNTLLVRLCYLILGSDPWVIRLPAFLAGILVLPASYLATRLLYNKSAALVAAALTACSYPLIFYSTNSRGYTMVCLAFLLILSLGARLLGSGWRIGWVTFAVLSALGFYAIPTMLYPFCIVVLWLTVNIGLRQSETSALVLLRPLILACVVALLLVLVLYAPVIFSSGWESLAGNKYVEPKSLSLVLQQLPINIGLTWRNWNTNISIGVQFILAFGAVVAVVFHRRMARHLAPIWLAALAILPLVLGQRVVPPIRVWTFMAPVYAMLASAGLAFVLSPLQDKMGRFRNLLFPALSLVLCLSIGASIIQTQSIPESGETGVFPHAEWVTHYLRKRLGTGDCLLTANWPSYWPLRYSFFNHGLSARYFMSEPETCDRVYLVAPTWNNQNLATVMTEVNWTGDGFSEPELIKACESFSMYDFRRYR